MSNRLKERYAASLSLLSKARSVTPGGAQTLSKRAESFVEGAFPCFISAGKDQYVKDVDNHLYLDFICALGAQTLGYANDYITQAITKQLWQGVNFSLPSVLEVEVAKKFIDMLPSFAEQVRFVKTGSEACTAAARIARMKTGRDIVIYVGYHGWHDGYISTRDFSKGIPNDYKLFNWAMPYNDLAELERLIKVSNNNLAAVMLEPTLIEEPKPGYLEQLIDVCHHYGVLVIFDEMICSGRWTFAGGSTFFSNAKPDLAVYGKFLAQGLPLGAIVGPTDIMKNAWVVSGTFGGELVSLAACSATLDLYDDSEIDVIGRMWELGNYLFYKVRRLFEVYEVPARIVGYPVHPKIEFVDDIDRRLMSIFLQELAFRSVLIHPGGFNISSAMTMNNMEATVDKIEEILKTSFWRKTSEIELYGEPWKDALRANVIS